MDREFLESLDKPALIEMILARRRPSPNRAGKSRR
jgi:hypothetical protein